MSNIKLLIIEDEDSQVQIYSDAIDNYNRKNDTKFSYFIFKTYDDGERALKSPHYDAAIIDLKLSNSESLEGKKLVDSVYKKIRIPIIIYSGSIAQIDDIQENALLKKRLRTEKFSSVLDLVTSIYNTGITKFLRPEGIVDQKLTDIFWEHLSQDLDIWINKTNPNALLRYFFAFL